jgi:hypothetical protein
VIAGILVGIKVWVALYLLQRLFALGEFVVECLRPEQPTKPTTHAQACEDGVEAWLSRGGPGEYKG